MVSEQKCAGKRPTPRNATSFIRVSGKGGKWENEKVTLTEVPFNFFLAFVGSEARDRLTKTEIETERKRKDGQGIRHQGPEDVDVGQTAQSFLIQKRGMVRRRWSTRGEYGTYIE